MKKILLIIILFPFLAFTQITGDYRSAGNGNWTVLTSWERYNGTTWGTPTSGQGYPGQNSGTGTVTVRDSNVITVNTNIANSFVSLVIGTGTGGKLIVDGTVTVNTMSVRVNSAGLMSFVGNSQINFPTNTSFVINGSGKLVSQSNPCSNQTALYIGSTKVSACTGGGGALSNFDSFSSGGGTGSATSNSPACAGNSLILTAIPPTATSGSYTYTYRWSGNGIYYNPDFSTTATYTIEGVNIYNHGGVYTVEIKRNDGFISTVSTNVVVNNSIAAPTNTRVDNVNWCTATIRWDGDATNFNLDVATTNTFSAGTILPAYNNLSVGNVRDLILSGLSSNTTYYFRVKSSGNCASTSYSPFASFTTTTIAAPVANSGYGSCNDWVAQWNGVYNVSGQEVDGYFLDVAIDNTFTNYVNGYQNLYVDKSSNRNYTITGLALGGVYYYRLRAKTSCGVSGNSNVVTFTEKGNDSSTPGTISGGSTSICVGSTATFIKDPNFWSSTGTGTWSIFNQTGSATITQAGVVTGVSVGTVKVIFTTYNGGCGTSTSTDLIVTSGSVVGTASASPILCANTAMSNITHTTTGATGIGTPLNLPAGVTASWSSNVITISGTPTQSGTFNYSIPLTGGCGSVSATGTIVVNTIPSTPTVGTPTNPTCTRPTGSVTLSGLPSSGTILQTGERPDNISITTGGSQTITGLLPGTYYFAVDNGSCISAVSTVVEIIAPETNTWSSGSWSKGTPTINQRLVFASDYTNANDVDLVGCSCQVTGSVAVTIKSGRTLKIENGVEVQPNATLTFENNASLVQENEDPNINSGNISYKRLSKNLNRYDFTYWSSPVAGQTLKALSPNTLFDKYYSYNNGWIVSYNGVDTMKNGHGYIIRAPQTFFIEGKGPAEDYLATFTGVPHNGVVTLSGLAANQAHLLGNPYPSAIDGDKFLEKNEDVLEGTLYFWTHNTEIQLATNITNGTAGSGTYAYTSDDYATYNRSGGIATRPAISGGAPPTGKIAAGQGFFAPVKATGNVEFNNTMRISGGASGTNNSQFFKLTSGKAATTTVAKTEKNRIWLNLTNTQGAFKQTLVGYITGATNNYEGGFDGITYDGNSFVDFYSINQDVNLAIQGRALPFTKKDSVALGYKSAIKGEFQISIDHTDGALSSQNVFIEDKDLKVLHDLKKGAYTFSTEKGFFNNRFVLRYVDKNAVEEVIEPQLPEEVLNKEITVAVKNKSIIVDSPLVLIDKVVVYDVAGRKLYQKEKTDANALVIDSLISGHQVLIVDIVLIDGTKLSRKIVY
ncbi:T9SS sorting signal type C domain-containing protein [Flavobacterium sp. ST-87]|uniref:T9SS sorting signal type C domain-containing protein n=1 Tax=Flavobacterium plantiphilum TaxID=3163297 RepID=A0ABW8XSJ3_9FLAO